MSVKDRINEDLKVAMKAKDKERTSVLRMLLSEIKYAQAAVNAHQDLPEDEVVKVVTAYHKRLVKSLDDYPVGEKHEAIQSEAKIAEEYLPRRAGPDEVEKVVAAVMAENTDRNFPRHD